MTDHEPRPSLALGGLYISLSMLAGALLSGLVKWASVGFSSEFIVAVRFASGLLVFAALLAMRPRVSLRTSQWQTQMAVAVSWALATLIFFYSIRFIRLMDAALLLNTAALFAPIFARVFDGKREPRLVWLGTLVGFVGVVVVLRPGPALLENPLSLIGLLAGIFSGLRMYFNGRLKGEPAKRTTFHSLMGGTVVAIFALVVTGMPIGVPNWETMLFSPRESTPLFVDSSLVIVAVACGILSAVQPLLIAAGLRHASVGQIAPFRYTAVIFAGVIDFAFWGVVPTWPSWVGFALVFAGARIVVQGSRKATMPVTVEPAGTPAPPSTDEHPRQDSNL